MRSVQEWYQSADLSKSKDSYAGQQRKNADRAHKEKHALIIARCAEDLISNSVDHTCVHIPLSMLAPPLISSCSQRSPCKAPARINSSAIYNGSWNLSFKRDATIALYSASPIGVCWFLGNTRRLRSGDELF